uniref:FAD-binding oxidoreductase n=1 Tax=Pararhizobium sp. IMCC3301 TaxID=3067904 RepID=UPI0027426124|nr:FAD-binding oxidoreductase [Pararhizobium sp. IMCC3301]
MDFARLKAELAPVRCEDNAAIVRQKSRDFFWYSPVLKRQLQEVTADLIAAPVNEAEVIHVLKTCFAHDVPVTPRGTGTGNYGQAMPLSGGVLLDLSRFNKIREISTGRFIAEPGAVIAEIDRKARQSGQEVRMYPSTYSTASIGGFIAGGSGGVGSINFGGLRDLGNVIRLRVVTMEAEPRILELGGEDLQKVSHAYGTNGIITEVEMPLGPAYDWVDVLVGFEPGDAEGFSGWMDAVRFGNELGLQDGILKKNIAPVQAPVPQRYFRRHSKFIEDGQSVCICMVAPFAMDAFSTFVARGNGAILYRSDTASAEEKKGLPPAYELAWNHTTLRGLRVDPEITYLQVLYPFPHQIERVEAVSKLFPGEVTGHLEYVRFDGHVTCFGLPIVNFTTEDRLEEIIRIHEEEGCPIFNPHRYTLEEGGMKQTDAVQLDFKREADPKGLLNPGKMVAWDHPEFDFSGQTYLFPGLERKA